MNNRMNNPFSIEGKRVLVTGASSGIGQSIAVECSRLGAKLIITGRNLVRLKNTEKLLFGDGHIVIPADINIKNDRDFLIAQLPPLDGLVHCAGIMKTVLFQFTSTEHFNEVMSTNFSSPVFLTHDLLEQQKIKKHASIVFISSIAGVLCSGVGLSMYSASKGALNGLVKGIALDLSIKGIRVNSIIPGMIETPLLNESLISSEQMEEDKKRYPLKRYGRPEEVAYGVIYLLSDAASWITGSNLLIDGGFTLT